MKISYSRRFLRSYAKAPKKVQKAFLKQADLLVANMRHPK